MKTIEEKRAYWREAAKRSSERKKAGVAPGRGWKKDPNEYRIVGDVAYVRLRSREGMQLEALVDLEDLQGVLDAGSWHGNPVTKVDGTTTYYAKASIRGSGKRSTSMLLHRFVMGDPDNADVDHIKGNTLDCRKSQLRIVTRRENARNTEERRLLTMCLEFLEEFVDGSGDYVESRWVERAERLLEV